MKGLGCTEKSPGFVKLAKVGVAQMAAAAAAAALEGMFVTCLSLSHHTDENLSQARSFLPVFLKIRWLEPPLVVWRPLPQWEECCFRECSSRHNDSYQSW